MTRTATQTSELTEAQYELADRITQALEADPHKLWTPSALGRTARSASTTDTYAAVRWLEHNTFIIGQGNGSWRKYRARQFGEYQRSVS